MIQNLLQTDEKVFYVFNNLSGQNKILDFLVMAIGKYIIYLVPILLLLAWFIYKNNKDRLVMLKTVFVSVILWQIPTRIIAHYWFRPRPFEELANTKELVFHVPSYSFPSDHATFLAAFSMYLYLLGYKKVAIISFVATFLVSISRIISGLHYPGDILFGWILGVVGAIIFFQFDKTIQKYIAQPILNLAKKIRLA